MFIFQDKLYFFDATKFKLMKTGRSRFTHCSLKVSTIIHASPYKIYPFYKFLSE